MCNLLSPERAV